MPGLFDRIKDTWVAASPTLLTTLSSFVVSGTAPGGYQTFSARYALAEGNIPVAIVSQTSNDWMTCWCTYTAANTLRVDTIMLSSNADAGVTFPAGTMDIFVTPAARAIPGLREVNTFTANNTFSGNLGFGIAPATNRLTIKSTVSGLNNTHWLAQDNGDLAAIFADSADNAWLRLWDGAGTEQFRLRSGGDTFLNATGGNVGIGTTSPVSRLDLGSIVHGTASTGVTVALWNLAGNVFGIGVSSGQLNYIAGTTSANSHVWHTNGGERVRIDTNGNVGIGAPSPLSVLHVERNQATETGLFINNPNASGYSAVRIGPSDRGTNFDMLLYSSTNASGIRAGSRPLLFESGAGTERMRMDVNGNLGIGTGTPSSYDAKLAVFNGNIALTTTLNKLYLYYFSSLNHAHISTDTGGQVTISNGTGGVTEKLRIDTVGWVGIGTTAPGGRLDVSSTTDNLVISRSTGGYAGFNRIAPAGQAVYDFYTINGVEQARITSVSPGIFAIATGSLANERLRIDGSGNVGINVPFTGATSRLVVSNNGNDIGGSAKSATFVTNSGSLGTTANSELALGSFGFVTSAGNQIMFGVRGYRISTGTDWTTTSIGLGMDVDNTVRAGASIWLSSNGSVGVSQVNPLARLHINSPDAVNAFLSSGLTRGLRIYHGPNGSVLEGVDSTGTGSFQPLIVGGSEVIFTTSTTERMRVRGDGGVAIGSAGGDYGRNWRLVVRHDNAGLAAQVGVINTSTTASSNARFVHITGTPNSFTEHALIEVAGPANYFSTEHGSAVTYQRWMFNGTERLRLRANGNLVIVNDTGQDDTQSIGFRGAPNNVQNAAYTFALTDAGKTVYHDEVTARTWTIPADSAVPFPIGTCIIIDNTGNAGAAGAITLQITTDTLRRGDGTAGVGTRTIAASRVAMIRKTKTTEWVITGTFA